jgi:hypothetical protein
VKAPQQLLSLVRKTLIGGNVATSSMLQACHISLDTTFGLIVALSVSTGRMDSPHLSGSTRERRSTSLWRSRARTLRRDAVPESDSLHTLQDSELILTNQYLCDAIEFLAVQMEMHILDPRVCREEVTWQVITEVLRPILFAYAVHLNTPTAASAEASGPKHFPREELVIACMDVIAVLLKESIKMGLDDVVLLNDSDLRNEEDSVYHAVRTILDHERFHVTSHGSPLLAESCRGVIRVLGAEDDPLANGKAVMVLGANDASQLKESEGLGPAAQMTARRRASFATRNQGTVREALDAVRETLDMHAQMTEGCDRRSRLSPTLTTPKLCYDSSRTL